MKATDIVNGQRYKVRLNGRVLVVEVLNGYARGGFRVFDVVLRETLKDKVLARQFIRLVGAGESLPHMQQRRCR